MVSRRDALHSLVAVASIAGAGCSSLLPPPGPNDDPPDAVGTDWSPDGDVWPLPAGGPGNARHSTLTVGGEPSVAWRVRDTLPSDDRAEWTIAAADAETVYAVLHDYRRGIVQARATDDGAVRWQSAFDAWPKAAGLVDGTVYLTLGRRHVLALDAADGTERWRFDAYARLAEEVPERYLPSSDPNDLDPVLTPVPGTLYAVTGYGLHGFDPADGTERWRVHVPFEHPSPQPRGVAVGAESVWGTYAFPDATLVELNGGTVHTGEAPWDGHASRPVPLEGRLCLTPGPIGSTGEVTPIAVGFGHVGDGAAPAWSFPGVDSDDGPTQVTAPASDGRRQFLGQLTPGVGRFRATTLALDVDRGTLEWLHRTPVDGDRDSRMVDDFVFGSPAVAGGVLLVGLSTAVADGGADPADGRLLALEAASGRERWRVPVGVAPGEVAVAGDRIYVAGRRGGLVALERSG